jgi:AraC family transcriptional regulator of arabinose operon
MVPDLHFTGTPTFHHCERGWSWSPLPLPDYDLWFILDGTGTLEFDGRLVPLMGGTCLLFAPGARPVARQDIEHRLRVFACHFDMDGNDMDCNSCLSHAWQSQHIQLQEADFFWGLARRCIACYHRGDVWSRQRSLHLLQQMLWHFYDESRSPGPLPETPLEDVARAVREEPGSIWTVKEMAQRAGLSPSQFTRRFRARMNVSPNHFVIQTRLDRARQLLRETDMTVGAIADALGYRDAHFFCRQFKAFTGHTPGSMR